MQDAALQVQKYLPAAAASNTTDAIDLGLYARGSNSNLWRLGKFIVDIPAMPNNSDDTKTVTLDLQDATNAAPSTFADTQPLVRVQIPGVASTGSLATTVEVSLPPGVRGPVRFEQTVPSGGGDNTGVQITYTWDWS